VLTVGVCCGFVTIFLLDIIPTWVVIILVCAAVALTVGPAILARSHTNSLALQESFQKPLEIAAAFALGIQFAGPWAWRLVGPALVSLFSPYANILLSLRFF